MTLYDWLKANYRVDTNRFYVLGMSMGGFGTLDFVATYPDQVAAAMAMCGGSTMKSLCGLTEVPLWIIHGKADKAVPVNRSERVVDSMCQCGDTSRLLFDKLDKVDHTALARVFYLRQTYEWLFSHALTDSLRPVNKDFSVSKALLYTAYDDLANKSDIKIVDLQSYKNSKKVYYVVKKGDTLHSIAVENNTTVSILCKLNRFKKDTKLWPGRKIRVK
jgi:pimeloyl-ACP methyl ester carboxylesterase